MIAFEILTRDWLTCIFVLMTSAGCEISDASAPEATPQPKLQKTPREQKIQSFSYQDFSNAKLMTKTFKVLLTDHELHTHQSSVTSRLYKLVYHVGTTTTKIPSH